MEKFDEKIIDQCKAVLQSQQYSRFTLEVEFCGTTTQLARLQPFEKYEPAIAAAKSGQYDRVTLLLFAGSKPESKQGEYLIYEKQNYTAPVTQTAPVQSNSLSELEWMLRMRKSELDNLENSKKTQLEILDERAKSNNLQIQLDFFLQSRTEKIEALEALIQNQANTIAELEQSLSDSADEIEELNERVRNADNGAEHKILSGIKSVLDHETIKDLAGSFFGGKTSRLLAGTKPAEAPAAKLSENQTMISMIEPKLDRSQTIRLKNILGRLFAEPEMITSLDFLEEIDGEETDSNPYGFSQSTWDALLGIAQVLPEEDIILLETICREKPDLIQQAKLFV
jgi:hypothetical protein